MKIICTGGRDYENEELVTRVIDAFRGVRIAVGCCPTGLDKIVRKNYHHREYKARWTELGRAAGPIRNKEMLVENQDAIVLAFPGGDGTEDCIRQAKKLGMVVIRVEDPTWQKGQLNLV